MKKLIILLTLVLSHSVFADCIVADQNSEYKDLVFQVDQSQGSAAVTLKDGSREVDLNCSTLGSTTLCSDNTNAGYTLLYKFTNKEEVTTLDIRVLVDYSDGSLAKGLKLNCN